MTLKRAGMKLAFLIRDNDVKSEYANASLPDGVTRTVGTYSAEGGDLYFVSFAMDGNTIGNARILATLRDSLPDGAEVRTLLDEASAKFCELLYPHFCRFEKGLREAIVVATCAEQGNFDDKNVVDVEERLTLEQLYNVLFVDGRFVKETRNLTKGNFTRDDLIASISALNENPLWNVLFSNDDMPTFRERRTEIKDRRNDVMHYHRMTGTVFDETRDLLKKVNDEIDAYLEHVRSDVTYPKSKAENARVAAQMLSETYQDMLETLRSSFSVSGVYDFSDQLSGISQLVSSNIDTSDLASAIQAANSLSGGVSLVRAAQQAMDQQTFGLSASVANAVQSMQASIPKIDLGQISAMQSAMESARSMLLSTRAQWADTFKGISDYYRDIIPSGAYDNLRLAASASMDFTAGLGVGSALSRAIEAGELDGADSDDITGDYPSIDDDDKEDSGEIK